MQKDKVKVVQAKVAPRVADCVKHKKYIFIPGHFTGEMLLLTLTLLLQEKKGGRVLNEKRKYLAFLLFLVQKTAC